MTLSKKSRIGIEILFFILLFFTYAEISILKTFQGFSLSLFSFCILYSHALINRLIIFPYLFPKKRTLIYIVFTFVLLFIFTLIVKVVDEPLNAEYYKLAGIKTKELAYIDCLSSLILSLFVMSSIQFFFEYIKISEAQKQGEKLLFELENNNLRSQLNPHFLFNALNNAYGLSLEEPLKAPEYILSLSQLMRYQIESLQKEHVLLREEVEFLENYLRIEDERIANRCVINFECLISEHEKESYNLPPLLFIDLLENSIKHGANSIEKSFVKIKIEIDNGALVFNCVNSIPSKKRLVKGTQSGLKNLAKRLELLGYRKNLKIEQSKDLFEVSLTVPLNLKK